MWHRRFRWSDITALCSGDEHGCGKCLTEAPGVRYGAMGGRGNRATTG